MDAAMINAVLRPWIARIRRLMRALGPYAVIELLLPGGSVIALLLWWYRSRTSAGPGV